MFIARSPFFRWPYTKLKLTRQRKDIYLPLIKLRLIVIKIQPFRCTSTGGLAIRTTGWQIEEQVLAAEFKGTYNSPK